MTKRLMILSTSLFYFGCASETTTTNANATGTDGTAVTESDAATATSTSDAATDATPAADTGGLPGKTDDKGGPDVGPDGGSGGPVTCETDADCSAEVCMSTLGCACFATPNGKVCVPRCTTDADCPLGPNVTLKCAPDGFCKPGNLDKPGTACASDADCDANCASPSGCKCSNGGCASNIVDGTSCTADADCEGACPPGSKGCACVVPPGTCVPTCAESADCPSKDGTVAECKDGKCKQGGGGGPP